MIECGIPIAAIDGGAVLALVFAAFVVFVVLLTLYVKVREAIWPRKVGNRMRRFFGKRLFAKIEAHDKSFPGYDLGSINRSVMSFLDECCTNVTEVGACPMASTLRDILVTTVGNTFGPAATIPSPPAFERMAVDVEREESFISHCVWFAVVRASPEVAHDHEQRIAIMISYTRTQEIERTDEFGDITSAQVGTTPTHITLSIACRSSYVADYVFKQIQDRRQRLSIYRGKIVEPEVKPGTIQSIGFRKARLVKGEDLVLPDDVRALVQRSSVGFYHHTDALRALGVELKRGLLLHGPPGTGKTSICLWLASLLPNFTVCFVSGSRLLYPREICQMARYLQPAMIVFEDIDLIAQQQDGNGLVTVLGELMNQIDGCDPDDQVLFVMTTNSLDRLEQAIRNRPGRVDQIVALPLPDLPARRDLVRTFGRTLTLSDAAVEAVARATDGATPAALKEIVKRAAVGAVDRGSSNGQVEVRADDLLLATEQVRLLRESVPPAR